MRCELACLVLAACGSDPSVQPDAAPDTGPAVSPLDGIGAVELVDGGYMFTEGPAWRGDLLFFTDIPANTIFQYTPGGAAPTIARVPSNNANGLAFDAGDQMFAAEHGSRTVTRMTGGNLTTIASELDGKQLNSPNDVVVADDGTVYFTDPPFGIDEADRELDFMGVFRISGTTLTAEHRGALTERPNGIGLSPDGTRLYVADSADGKLYRFPITGGALGPREVHAQTAGGADGLAIDEAGNIFVATVSGIEVFAPDGTRWGLVAVPERPSNCAFGDADHKRLYITAQTSVYRVAIAHPGLPLR
ncbi:MAG: SMP-30/gluconolactonase/LRE family protein [Kofleriaceae bacterium]